jgi:adenylate cyclase class IV
VQGLGKFIEVEAIDHNGELGLEKIQAQCDHYASLFQITTEDYVAISYSDLLMNLQNNIH